MKKSVLIILLLIFTGSLSADIKILYGPYLQAVGEHEADIIWITDNDAVSWVELAANDGRSFYNTNHPKYYQQSFGRKNIGKRHVVHLTGLKKNTTYQYRIFSQEVTQQSGNQIFYGKVASTNVYRKKPLHFTTLNSDKQQIRFCMLSDLHGKDSLFRTLTADVKQQNYDFVVFNGDMSSSMLSQDQIFQEYLQSACEEFAAETPFFFVRGNHEQRGTFAEEFMNYFPTTTGKPYYTFQQGPAYFLVLDGGEDKPDSDIEYYGIADFDAYRAQEAEWLKEQLNSEAFQKAPYKIVLIHMPPARSGKDWYGVNELRKLFLPLLQQKGIDLMLCGHEHKLSILEQKDTDFGFPVVINSNKDKLDVTIDTATGIQVKVINQEGKTIQQKGWK